MWVFRRLHSEMVLPTTKPGKAFHALLRKSLSAGLSPVRAMRRMFHKTVSETKGTLIAFYDLKVEPITFDVLWFLTGADLERRRLGLERVHVVIVPGLADGLRMEDAYYETAVDREARRWRIQNVLLGACSLLPSCASLTLAGSRAEAAMIRAGAGSRVYPRTYEPALPAAHHPDDSLVPARSGVRPVGVLRAGIQALHYIDHWIATHAAGRKLVTVTLRDYEYSQARNSNIADWAGFARQLDPVKYLPVFVLDTERALDETPPLLSDLKVFKEVSWNIGLRMALYERAWLNLGVNNGPMCLCWLNDRTRYITFKMVTPSAPQATVAFNRSRGFEPNQSLPFATPFQKWVWEDDTRDIIQREFHEIAARIEGTVTL